MSLTAGTRLGPYEITAPLGSGGMGEVYRARDSRLRREVAVKVLPAAVAADPDRLHRFEQEALAASALNHPNILTIHDVGQATGISYVVFELLEGQTLRERLATGAFSGRKAVDYGVQIANGLAAAHDRGIVHRDLKPENLFVTPDGRVKILDFGLAKMPGPSAADANTGLVADAVGTEPGLVLGTVGYMSPEQVRGERADHRSDIFAFGAVLYEMLAGQRAFGGASAIEAMHAILKDEPPETQGLRSNATPSLDRIVRRCLEKSPGERFQSARDLGFALNEAISGPEAAVQPVASPGNRRWLWLVSAVAALVAALVAWNMSSVRERLGVGAPAGPIKSLAVLPSTNISGDPQQEYFADGMTEELIIGLKQIGSLHVISRTSVMTYKGTKKTLPQIGGELGVQAILETSVERAGDRVRIRAQLTEAATERHLWAKAYERDLRNILSLQSEVAQAVADEIRAAVTPAERVRLAKTDEVDPQVHELYLRGKFHLGKGTEEALEQAIGFFEQALAKNQSYAPAHVGLAESYYSLSDIYRPPLEVLPKSKAAAIKALALDERLAGAHVALGAVHLYFDWDWTAAESAFKRAIEIDPGNASAHDFYGTLLAAVLGRRDEGIAQSRAARQLDPLSLLVQFNSGWVHFIARQYDEAISAFRMAITLEPLYGWAHAGLAISYAELGRKAEAVAAADEGRRVDQSPLVLALAGGAYAMVGEVAKAREVVARLNELTAANRYVCAYEVGLVHVGLGEPDDAFRWLDKGYRDRSSCMPFIKLDPRLDPVRSDPRYNDLVRRVGFPP